MTDMPDAVFDESLYDYFIVFYMEGIRRRFEYEISKATYDRVRVTLEDDDIGNLVFEAYRPAEQVVLNSRYLQLAHFQWRPKVAASLTGREGQDPQPEEAPPGAGERIDTIALYFTAREEPVRLKAADPDEVFDLVLAVETEAFSRCSLVDANGEEAVLDIRRLVCAEFPFGLGGRGEDNALLEIEEEA